MLFYPLWGWGERRRCPRCGDFPQEKERSHKRVCRYFKKVLPPPSLVSIGKTKPLPCTCLQTAPRKVFFLVTQISLIHSLVKRNQGGLWPPNPCKKPCPRLVCRRTSLHQPASCADKHHPLCTFELEKFRDRYAERRGRFPEAGWRSLHCVASPAAFPSSRVEL